MDTQVDSHALSTLLTAPWFLVVVGGFICLGLAIAYGMSRTRRRVERDRAAAAAEGRKQADLKPH